MKVEFSKYASPVVLVLKEEREICVCGDYKTNLNPNIGTKFDPLPTVEGSFAKMREVLNRLEKAGFKCKIEKSKFLQDSVIYLGHKVSRAGIHPCRVSWIH